MPNVSGPGQPAALMFCVTSGQRGEHIDHISEKGFVSEFHFGWMHKTQPCQRSDEETRSKKRGGQRVEQARKVAGLGSQKKSTQG